MDIACKLTTEEVIGKLSEKGIETNNWLLSRSAREGLIPKPLIKRFGRGKGTVVFYDNETPAEYYANKMIKKHYKLPYSDIVAIRGKAIGAEFQSLLNSAFDDPHNFLAILWLYYKANFNGGTHNNHKIIVSSGLQWGGERYLDIELKVSGSVYKTRIREFKEPEKLNKWLKILRPICIKHGYI